MKYPVSRTLSSLVVLSSIILLAGCGRIIDWTRDSFYQGQELAPNDVPRQYLRSVTVYDQFETVGMFDALWLSDAVKTAYTNVWGLKLGKTPERQQAFLRRQLEENRHFISFYVLSLQNIRLDDATSDWSVFLQINDTTYTPIQLSILDELDYIYKSFFGSRCNRFKDVYLVKFDAQDAEDKPLIDQNTKTITLFFRSTKKQAILMWDLQALGYEVVPV